MIYLLNKIPCFLVFLIFYCVCKLLLACIHLNKNRSDVFHEHKNHKNSLPSQELSFLLLALKSSPRVTTAIENVLYKVNIPSNQCDQN